MPTPTTPRFCCFFYRQAPAVGLLKGVVGSRAVILAPDGESVRRPTSELLLEWEGESPLGGSAGHIPSLGGRVSHNPALGGRVSENPALGARISHHPALGGNAGPPPGSPEDQFRAGLEALPGLTPSAAQLEALAEDVLNAPALHDAAQPFVALADRAARLFGWPYDGQAGWRRAALYLALLEATSRFRHVRGRFTALSTEEAALRAARREEAAGREDRLARWRAFRDSLEGGVWPPRGRPSNDPPRGRPSNDSPRGRPGTGAPGAPPDQEARDFADLLAGVLIDGKSAPQWKEAAPALGLNGLAPLDLELRLKTWLDQMGTWPGWPEVWLRQGGIDRSFTVALEDAAREMAAAPPAVSGHQDYRATATFTIDASGTEDFDDAFSILEVPEVQRGRGETMVAVHIAMPPPEVAPGAPLYDEAVRRGVTAYTLEGVFPMLPRALSGGRFSLQAGQEREVLTMVFWTGLDGAEPELVAMHPALIRVDENLDFAQARERIGKPDHPLHHLSAVCAGLAARREAAGAHMVERHEAQLDISDPERIGLNMLHRNGPEHTIVEELAVLYNRHAAAYCREHGIPALYRVQTGPAQPQEEEEGAAGSPSRGEGVVAGSPSRGEARRNPQSVQLSTRPGKHHGLAVPEYLQMTSPIRRAADLVMQRQVVAHLRGAPLPYPDVVALEELGLTLGQRTLAVGKAQRLIGDFWKRRYLAQQRGRLWRAAFRRNDAGGVGRVWLEELDLIVRARLEGQWRPGDTLEVRVESIHHDRREVWVVPV